MGKKRKKDKITLSLRNASVLRKVAAFSEQTCSDLVDEALDDWFQRQADAALDETSEEEVQEMVTAARIANTMGARRKVAIQGNSAVQDALKASRTASQDTEE